MSQCVFCRIAAHEIPATIVREDEHTVAFRDLDPKAPVHVLIVPRRHVTAIADVAAADEPVLGRLLAAAADVARSEGVDTTGYRLVMNTGPDAGQTVPHMHLHLLAGRALRWPPG